MNSRLLIASGLALLLAAAGGVVWFALPDAAAESDAGEADATLPVPPVPPRIATGADYENCLSMLGTDPAGAAGFAEAWVANGGGDGAAHCLALSKVALGEAASGAEMLQALATSGRGAAAARAAVFGQATQAWMMAGETANAYATATLALALLPDDPDLLLDRAQTETTLDRHAAAVEDLGHLLAIDPRRGEALVLRATALRHLNKLDLARADIDHALTLDPDNAEALLERGIERQRRGDRKGAREDWQRVVELAPDSATADLAQQNLALLEAGPGG